MAKKKESEHEALVETARKAIEAVNSDTSVSQEQTIESLDALASLAQSGADAIREEMEG